MRHIFLDTETTGLSPAAKHRVIEIGAIEMIDRRLTGRTFHYYLNPKRSIDPGAQAVHGITADFLTDKPFFEDVCDEFIEFIEGATLIIHNAPFDVGFLDYELSLCKKKKRKPLEDYAADVIDTLILARKTYPGQKNSLDALCKRLDINNSHRELHGALLDSEILAEVYLAMTGGQQAMAWETETVITQAVTQVTVTTPVLSDVVIVRASDAELALDADYFKK
ncbi:MAG: DNA polymerase III subunit epsilon [Gammaproteobacteria bacterium]